MDELISEGTGERARKATHGTAMRLAGPAALAQALTAGSDDLIALFDGFQRALGAGGLHIAQTSVVNLPLWELGHIAWFEEFWLSRNPGRAAGAACDPLLPRAPSLLADADAFYDSSNVAHASRWQLALPDADATRAYVASVRERTLALLQETGTRDDDLYFFRLVLFHEAMHREAWQFIAQGLGIDLGVTRPGEAATASPSQSRSALLPDALQVPAGVRRIGVNGPGVAFDNELGAHDVDVPAFSIDRTAVRWAAYLPFIDAGGYTDEALWTPAGRDWLRSTGATRPLHLRRGSGGWERSAFGRWAPIDPMAAAVQLTAHEADAWCRWAGRRLPTEMEWETAATVKASASAGAGAENEANAAADFAWGDVWEWTSSPFEPYPGFTPHPYRDYSQPWFDGRRVLRGGSFATAASMKHPRYRNFFPAERNDVFAGFRSCAAT